MTRVHIVLSGPGEMMIEPLKVVAERFNLQVNLLCSYWYFKKTDMKKFREQFKCPLTIMGDSGGFTASLKGKPIDPHEYADWLDKWAPYLDCYMNLDIVHDAKASAKNLKVLESRGHTPLPIFHTQENFRILKTMAEQYDYICLGGLVPYSSRRTMLSRYLTKCMSMLQGKKVHFLGVSNYDHLRMLRPFSCDSSSWSQGSRFGNAKAFDPFTGKMYRVDTQYQAIQYISRGDREMAEYLGSIKRLTLLFLLGAVSQINIQEHLTATAPK